MSAVSIREISIPLVLAFGIMASIGMSLYTFGQYREATTNDIRSLKTSDDRLNARLARIEENLATLVETVRAVAQDRANTGLNAFSRVDCAALMMRLKIKNPDMATPDCFALPEARRLSLSEERDLPRLNR